MKSTPKKIRNNSLKNILKNRKTKFKTFTQKLLNNIQNYTTKDFFKYCKFRKKYLNDTNKSISNYYEDIINKNTKFLSSFNIKI